MEPVISNSSSPKVRDENNAMRERTGSETTNLQLVGFLYELLRDHLPSGDVEKLVRYNSDPEIKQIFTNGFLARYAKDIAARLGVTESTDPNVFKVEISFVQGAEFVPRDTLIINLVDYLMRLPAVKGCCLTSVKVVD